MLRKVVASLIALMGLILTGFCVVYATWLTPETEVNIKAPQNPTALVAFTSPGVLGAVDNKVTVTVHDQDERDLVMVMGRAVDVQGWVGQSAALEISGLKSWEKLDTNLIGEPMADALALNPDGSDLWTWSKTGKGTLSAEFSDVPTQNVLLIAGLGTAGSPEITFTWQREVNSGWVWPLLLLGVLSLFGGSWWLWSSIRAERELEKRNEDELELAVTGQIPQVRVQIIELLAGKIGEEPNDIKELQAVLETGLLPAKDGEQAYITRRERRLLEEEVLRRQKRARNPQSANSNSDTDASESKISVLGGFKALARKLPATRKTSPTPGVGEGQSEAENEDEANKRPNWLTTGTDSASAQKWRSNWGVNENGNENNAADDTVVEPHSVAKNTDTNNTDAKNEGDPS